MTGRWAGAVDLGSGWLRYRGPVIEAELHAHHAVQVIVALDPVTLASASGETVTTDRAVVPANVLHRIDARGQEATLTYLEPPPGRPAPAGGPAAWAAAGAELGDLSPKADLDAVLDLRSRFGSGATQATGGPIEDRQVRKAQAVIRANLPARIALPVIAAEVAMSPSRLTHRFSAATGIPFRRWVLWERLQLAGTAVAQGADLTEAAHRSGFADSAHLNRTFRKTFGITPSEVTSAVSWQVHP
jgi:AraC-like DNA-binding protein